MSFEEGGYDYIRPRKTFAFWFGTPHVFRREANEVQQQQYSSILVGGADGNHWDWLVGGGSTQAWYHT